MLLNCREVLKELFHATDTGAVQDHNELLASSLCVCSVCFILD